MEQKAYGSSLNGSNLLFQADLQKLLDLIKTVKYGSITLIIQDSRLVQIDKHEKVRLK